MEWGLLISQQALPNEVFISHCNRRQDSRQWSTDRLKSLGHCEAAVNKDDDFGGIILGCIEAYFNK